MFLSIENSTKLVCPSPRKTCAILQKQHMIKTYCLGKKCQNDLSIIRKLVQSDNMLINLVSPNAIKKGIYDCFLATIL